MRRRLFTILSALSLLLCAIACGLWAQSVAAPAAREFSWGARRWEVASAAGTFRLSNEPERLLAREPLRQARADLDQATRALTAVMDRIRTSSFDGGGEDRYPFVSPNAMGPAQVSATGEQLRAAEQRYNEALRQYVDVATWHDRHPPPPLAVSATGYAGPAALAAVLPLAWAVSTFAAAVRRWRLFRRSHCRRCGYDLRATPGRCPECGTAAANA